MDLKTQVKGAMAENGQLIRLEGVTRVYQMGDVEVRALCGVDFEINGGEWVAIMGPSGSGKSTLMNILGCLDKPSAGNYWLAGTDVGTLNDNQLADIRSQRIGFVFQQFNLLSRTSALQNVELPMMYAANGKSRRDSAVQALEAVGLSDRMHHRPNELSGGQQQRVAIARALVNQPDIIMADEPTGNLDSKTGREIMALFEQLHNERNITIIFVTHDPELARQVPRRILMRDGMVVEDARRAH
jgi:putative ABC transport system ATP-binding protein